MRLLRDFPSAVKGLPLVSLATYLCSYLQSYYEALDDEGTTLPVRLRGKRNVVFGNIVDIHKFHSR